MEEVQTQGAGALAAAQRWRGWEADARSQKGSPLRRYLIVFDPLTFVLDQ